jgi:hypothetical protein
VRGAAHRLTGWRGEWTCRPRHGRWLRGKRTPNGTDWEMSETERIPETLVITHSPTCRRRPDRTRAPAPPLRRSTCPLSARPLPSTSRGAQSAR